MSSVGPRRAGTVAALPRGGEQVGHRQGVFAAGDDQGSAQPPVLGDPSCFLTFGMTSREATAGGADVPLSG